MKLLIFGNLASGKTSLALKINHLTKWKVVAIDDFRRQFGDGSKENELVARKYFFDSIIPGINQIIECTGVGKVGEELFMQLRGNKETIVLIILKVPHAISKKRLENRKWDIPFPHPLVRVNSLIDKNEVIINSGIIEKSWSVIPKIKILVRENKDFDDLNFIINEVAEIITTSN